MNEPLFYNLKVGVEADQQSMQQTYQRMKEFAKDMQPMMFGGGDKAGGGGGVDLSSLPTDQFEKYIKKVQSIIDGLKNKGSIDVSKLLFERLTDENLSQQDQVKILRTLSKQMNALEGFYENAKRRIGDITKEMFPGKSAGEQGGIVNEIMRQGLGGDIYSGLSQAGASSRKFEMEADDINKSVQTVMNKPDTKRHLRLFGQYIMGYMFSNLISAGGSYIESSMMTSAQAFQRTGTTFDLTSFVGSKIQTSQMRMANEMAFEELSKKRSELIGSGAGSALGLGIGLLLAPMTGGASIPLGMLIGGSAGSTTGGIIGTSGISELVRKQTPEIAANKFLEQVYGIAERFSGSFDEMDVARRRFAARTGRGSIPGAGLGYTDAELYQLGLSQSGVTGQYDPNTFLGQTAFARAFGYNPQDIYSAGMSTRFTGQNVGANELMMRKELADRMGIGSRLPEMIQAMNQLAAVMTKSGVNATEADLQRFSMLPNMLFGNTARGRLPDLGMETIMGMQSMFGTEAGSAQDAFLFQALFPQHKGNIYQFQLMKEQGIFGKGNLRSILSGASKYGALGENGLNALFEGMGVQSASLRKAIIDKAFVPGGGLNEDFIKQFESIDTNTEEGKDRLAELLGIAKDQVSGAEKTNEIIKRIESTVGAKIAPDIHQMRIDLAKMQGSILGDKDTWQVIMNQMQQGMKDFLEAVKMMKDVFEQTKGYTQNERDNMFNAVTQKQGWEKAFTGLKMNEVWDFNKLPFENDGWLYIPVGEKQERSPSGNMLTKYKYLQIEGTPSWLKVMNDIERDEIQKDVWQQYQWEKERRSKNPDGKGGGENIINFFISASERAQIHQRLDEHLDELTIMAHPRKVDNQ